MLNIATPNGNRILNIENCRARILNIEFLRRRILNIDPSVMIDLNIRCGDLNHVASEGRDSSSLVVDG